MEWVETTGRTIDDAKEAALDELGVDEQDAEFEVIDEPRLGLFGRLRSEGRVRARVRPVAPPSKDDRRRRGRSGPKTAGAAGSKAPSGAKDLPADDESSSDAATAKGVDDATLGEKRAAPKQQRSRSTRGSGAGTAPRGGSPSATEDRSKGSSDRPSPPSSETGNGSDPAVPAAKGTGRRTGAKNDHRDATRGEGNEVEVSLEEQGSVAEEFLRGLVDEFGLTVEIATTQPDDDTLHLGLTGDDLGMLIGPKGATLLAIQDLTRTVVQRRTGANNGRIHVDVSGYRQKRAEALTRFAHQVADEVKSSGVRKTLEPMAAPDRKVVHDALTEVEGVSTESEGEDAQRRVVILPSE